MGDPLYDRNKYRSEYEYTEKDVKWTFWKVFGVLIVLSVIFGIWDFACGMAHETATVAQQEFGPRASLDKYMWFKEASAQLDKKQADIKLYAKRITNLEDAYKGKSRGDWPRDDREQMGVWQSEVSGVKASYNSLAADYNAKMKEFNWAFANKGELPQGATEPLPREYKPYAED